MNETTAGPMGDLENATADDLLAWANGLNVCRFEKAVSDGKESVVCAGEKVRIELEFGRFCRSVPKVGGMRGVHINSDDDRCGYSGSGFHTVDLDELADTIERNAEKLGLVENQLAIF